jgi:hypothetical protein
MRHFIFAFSLCLAVFGCMNLASYSLLSTPTYQLVGFPFRFWTQWSDGARFRVVSFVIDLGVALFSSYRVGRWWALHCWQKADQENAA